jgi:hypothetical protein
MFGLEDQKKKKKTEEFVFELEKELQNPKKHKELKERTERRLLSVKEALKKGTEKLDFDKIGVVLNGYASLLKVFSRFTPKG